MSTCTTCGRHGSGDYVLYEHIRQVEAECDALKERCDRWEDTHREMVMERAAIICERDVLRARVEALEKTADLAISNLTESTTKWANFNHTLSTRLKAMEYVVEAARHQTRTPMEALSLALRALDALPKRTPS